MCGRYALFGPQSRYRDHFEVEAWPDFADRYNIAPTAWVPVIRQAPDDRRVADLLRWGLIPHWAKDAAIGAKLNNARGETAGEKPAFRSAFRSRRCLVPASGFYEWQAVAGQKWKQPWFFAAADGRPLAMAGLWENWTDPSGQPLRTFCILTTSANGIMAPVHDRMPVLVEAADWATWLNPRSGTEAIAALVAPATADTLTARRVSRRVSNAREEGPEMIQPVLED